MVDVLARVWAFWNAGQRYYLSAGSDTHDVWNEESGRVRTYVRPDGPLSVATFVAALKAGHAYVTYGPLIFPSTLFGTQIAPRAGEAFTLGFDLDSVAGLKQVQLVSDELTPLCPVTGQPDLYRLTITCRPEALCVESK